MRRPKGFPGTLAAVPVLAAAACGALAGEAGNPPAGKAEQERPLCRVDIVPLEGLPSRGLVLTSYRDGVYRVRTERDEFEVGEAEIRSVTFYPLRKKRPGRRPGFEPEASRPGGLGFLREAMWRRTETRRKLEELKRAGKLDHYISKRRAELASAASVEKAMKLLFDLALANQANGTPVAREDWKPLIASIRDPAVRKRVAARQKLLIQSLDRPRPRPGPRRRQLGPSRSRGARTE